MNTVTRERKFYPLLASSEQISPHDVILKFYATKTFDLKPLFAEYGIGLKYLSIWERKDNYDAPWLDKRLTMRCLVDLDLRKVSFKDYQRAVYLIQRSV